MPKNPTQQPIFKQKTLVGPELDKRPLDAVVRALTGASWTKSRKLVETGKVTIDGSVVTRLTLPVAAGALVGIDPAAPGARVQARARHRSELIAFLDAHVVVVRKPAGISTIPFGDETSSTEVSTLDAVVRDLLSQDARTRGRAPLGVVQRLDKGTSGLLVFARTLEAKKHLAQQLRVRAVGRKYLALAHGVVAKRTITSYLMSDRGDGRRGSARGGTRAGKESVTHVSPLETLAGGAVSLVECVLGSGRTHQIRIHLAEAGHPILGETVYGDPALRKTHPAPRAMLHAASLAFDHPATGRRMEFNQEPPEDFQKLLDSLR